MVLASNAVLRRIKFLGYRNFCSKIQLRLISDDRSVSIWAVLLPRCVSFGAEVAWAGWRHSRSSADREGEPVQPKRAPPRAVDSSGAVGGLCHGGRKARERQQLDGHSNTAKEFAGGRAPGGLLSGHERGRTVGRRPGSGSSSTVTAAQVLLCVGIGGAPSLGSVALLA
jgi:hypothetical protein